MKVYLLWHVHHACALGDSEICRKGAGRELDWDLDWDEEDGDDVKLLGVYSTRNGAEERVRSARSLSGFRDDPDCFVIDEYQVDQDKWADGFRSVEVDR